MPFPSKIQSAYCRLPLHFNSMLFECTHICYIKTKWNHLPLKSHLPLHASQKTCVVVHICRLKHTHQCVSRLQEHWSLSAPHSTAARNRVACTMLNWVLFTPAAVSHTCCSCVHHGLCPTCKLHQSDNLLHQQSELLWSPASVSPQSVSLCGSGPHRALCSSQNLSHTCHSRADAATVQVASCTELLFAVICRSRSQSCTHNRAAFSIIVARDELTSATISHAHWSATRPEQLLLYATWDQAAIVGVTLARGTLTAAIIHTKWDPTGHTKSPRKHLIHGDSQRHPKLITNPFRVPPTSFPWRERWLLSRPRKGNLQWWRILEKLWIYLCVLPDQM